MKEEIKIEDLVKGEWYIIKCNSTNEYLIKFDKINGNQFLVLYGISFTFKDKTTKYLCNLNNINIITKAIKEEVLKYFPNEKFEEEIPEYVECIYLIGWEDTIKENKGVIFDTSKSNIPPYNNTWKDIYNKNNLKINFKPSTKEAYDLQELKSKLEVGKWYKITAYSTNSIYFIKYLKFENVALFASNFITSFGNLGNNGQFTNVNIIKSEGVLEEIQSYLPSDHQDKIVKEFVLPNNWYIIVNNENIQIIKNWWENSNIKTHCEERVWSFGTAYGVLNGVRDANINPLNFGGKEITFEQFKKYVLKEDIKNSWEGLLHPNNIKDWSKASKKELLAEAKRRYPVGTRFISPHNNIQYTVSTNIFNNSYYESGMSGCILCYRNKNTGEFLCYKGKWAEIIENNLKENKMENKEIIGYKCPQDLYSGNIKKGQTLVNEGKGTWKILETNDSSYILPNELVETWEPVYKSIEQVISMNGKFNLTIRDKKVYHKNEDITDFVIDMNNTFNKLQKLGIYTARIKDITFASCGCETDKETYLSDWLKVYDLIK